MTLEDSAIVKFGPDAQCTSTSPNFSTFFTLEQTLPGQNIGSGHEPNHGVTADARAAGGYSRA